VFTLNDGVTNATHGRDPNWYWQSTTREENVYDVPIADAAAVPGTSGTGRYISVPDGYRSTLASVTGTNVFQQRFIPNVGSNLIYQARRYGTALLRPPTLHIDKWPPVLVPSSRSLDLLLKTLY
jgi:hypothetical protein